MRSTKNRPAIDVLDMSGLEQERLDNVEKIIVDDRFHYFDSNL
jgi:hypothetical protein